MKDEGAEQLGEEEGTMKSALEVRDPSREVPQHRAICITLDRGLAVGMVANPTWGKVKCPRQTRHQTNT